MDQPVHRGSCPRSRDTSDHGTKACGGEEAKPVLQELLDVGYVYFPALGQIEPRLIGASERSLHKWVRDV
jgi:hypothetical protein